MNKIAELKLIQYDGIGKDLRDLTGMLLGTGALKFGKFTLTSGKESDFYVDVKQGLTNPQVLRKYAKVVSRVINPDTYDHPAGIELGAVPLATAVSLETNKDFLIIRKEKPTHGTKNQVIGRYKPGAKVVTVEDVFTTGGSAVKAATAVEEAGLELVGIIGFVDRQEGAAENLESRGYTYNAILPIADIRNYKADLV